MRKSLIIPPAYLGVGVSLLSIYAEIVVTTDVDSTFPKEPISAVMFKGIISYII
jgi:hypothetical protein